MCLFRVNFLKLNELFRKNGETDFFRDKPYHLGNIQQGPLLICTKTVGSIRGFSYI
jgi:hypothetical protein